MRRFIGICLLVLSISQSAFSSEPKLLWSAKASLSAELVPFIFNFYGQDKTVDRIEVINSVTQQAIQQIKDFQAPVIEQQFALMDVNFDGVKDIRLGAAQPGFHYYWVYDRQTGQFKRDRNLEKIAYAEFDHKTKKIISASHVKQNMDYLYSLANRKAICLAKINDVLLTGEHEQIIKAQVQLSECYKKVILDLAEKFYSPDHFGQDFESEINALVEQHHHLLNKMAHCPASKRDGCRHYEQYDVLAGTVDYLNELIEFMVLNVGEGYAGFNPERWLKRWDAVLAKG